MVNRYRYLLIYTLILALPLILRASIFVDGFSNLLENADYYAIYLLIGVIASFGRDRVRNLALLFRIGTSVYWLLRILGFPLSYHNDFEILRFLYIISYIFLFYFWYLSFKKDIRIWQIFIVLFISIIFNLVSLLYERTWDFSFFYISCAEAICDNILIVLGLVLGALFSLPKNIKQKLITFLLFTIIAFLSSIYLSRGIVNFMRYGSLSGMTEKPVSLSFFDVDGNLCLQKNFKEKYSILFLWDNLCSRHLWAMNDLERYYWKYKNNNNVRFCVISINQNKIQDLTDSYLKYDSYHSSTPLYVAADSAMFCKELDADPRNIEYVCLLRNDTLIYKNTMLKVGEYLDELIEKTP